MMVRRGARTYLIPSPEYTEWQQIQSYQIKKIPKPLENIEQVMIKFYFPDNRKADMTNKAESVMDLLVDNHIIPDDAWQFVPLLGLSSGGIDKENPRAEVQIYTKLNV